MAQIVKHLLCKRESLSSALQLPNAGQLGKAAPGSISLPGSQREDCGGLLASQAS